MTATAPASLRTSVRKELLAALGQGQLIRLEKFADQLADWLYEAGGALSVKAFGAKGDGVTDDSVAANAAVAVAYETGSELWWPPGDYRCNSTIVNLHEVRNRGRGRIIVPGGGINLDTDAVIDVAWQVEANSAAINRIYASPLGNDANDGLTTSRPVASIARAFAILSAYGPVLFGQWDIKLLVGGYFGNVVLDGIRSSKAIRIYGPALTKTGDSGAAVETPERHAYENPVPTAVIVHASTTGTGSNTASPSGRGITFQNYVSVDLKNIKFLGPWDIGLYGNTHATLTLRNIHFDLENAGDATPSGGNTNPWRLGGRACVTMTNFVRYTAYGGRAERAEIGYYELFGVARNFDVLNESLRNAAGTFICHCGVGVKAKENTTGHMDFMTCEDSATGIELQAWSTANLKGSNFRRCGAGVVLVNGEAHNESGVDFVFGTTGDRYENSVPFLMYGNSSALVGFGWEANYGNPSLRNGYRPMNMIGSDYAPALPGDVWLGATTPNSQRIYQELCLPANVYNVQGMRFTTKLVCGFPPGTLAGTVKFLYTVSDVFMLTLTIPSGIVVPANGALIYVEFDTVCVSDQGDYRCVASARVVSEGAVLSEVAGTVERTIDLTDNKHSVGVDTRIANTADTLYFLHGETWG